MHVSSLCALQMAPGGGPKAPPPAVKKLLGLFGSGREEDKMVGYLSFLKVGVCVGCRGWWVREEDNTWEGLIPLSSVQLGA
jgi:hypothetical protein